MSALPQIQLLTILGPTSWNLLSFKYPLAEWAWLNLPQTIIKIILNLLWARSKNSHSTFYRTPVTSSKRYPHDIYEGWKKEEKKNNVFYWENVWNSIMSIATLRDKTKTKSLTFEDTDQLNMADDFPWTRAGPDWICQQSSTSLPVGSNSNSWFLCVLSHIHG